MVGSLLTAIVKADGDALVLHVGEKPYVVAATGPAELSSRPLTLEAVSGLLGQLLTPEGRATLDEFGAVEHELPRSSGGERFTVVAARGGDDIWIEIRRHRRPVIVSPARAPELVRAPLEAPEASAAPETSTAAPAAAPEPAARAAAALVPPPEPAASAPETPAAALAKLEPERPAPEPERVVAAPAPLPWLEAPAVAEGGTPPPKEAPVTERAAAPAVTARQPEPIVEPIPAVVLPLARSPVRPEPPSRVPCSPRLAGIDRLLRLAAARGANTLYLMSQVRPSVRVDGEVATLESEPALTAPEVESLLLDLAPERSREALRNGEGTEWMSEVADVGRIRCQSFRDHRGPGGIFRIISARPTSADQLGLSREIQALSAEPEGLVLVAGPRASGKSTLVAALVDLINATRNDYVITLESQIQFAHEGRGCLISQREVRGDASELAAAARGALRENPDVLVIDDLRSREVVGLALDAVAAGHLVIAAIAAHTTPAALMRVVDQAPPERREQVQLTLAEGLRGAVAQVLLHKSSGGRVAARELLLNTPSISSMIAEGRLGQLPLALDSGRKHGMAPLNDSLAAFVRSGVVDVKEAYRKAHERPAFLAVLKREGVDTSFVERLA